MDIISLTVMHVHTVINHQQSFTTICWETVYTVGPFVLEMLMHAIALDR